MMGGIVKGYLRTIVLSILMTAALSGCRSGQTLKSQTFDYATLTKRFFLTEPDRHFPLTVQRGINRDPFTLDGRYLFYTSEKDGAKDIWMRDLTGTVNIPVVRHPAQQAEPSISTDGKTVAFISFDRDSGGDIRIASLPDGPRPLVEDALAGLTPRNLWENSINLSELMEKFFENDPQCSGEAKESSPLFDTEGTGLYFTSDRCQPGVPEIWRVALNKRKPAAPPVRLSEGGTYSLSASSTGTLIYLSYRNDSTSGSIYIYDPESQMEREVYRAPSAERILIASPALSPAGEIYFIVVKSDTNGDGIIGTEDLGSIHSFGLKDRIERVILDSSAPLSGLHISSFNGGSILYPAEEHGYVNIHQIPESGPIPRQDTIDGQYETTKNYLLASTEKYLLSLDAVKHFFNADAAYPIYEGITLIDRLRRLQKSRAPRSPDMIREAAEIESKNPYASILLEIEKSPVRKIDILRAGAFRSPPRNLTEEAKSLIRGRLREDLANALSSVGRFSDALTEITSLNREYPNYPWRERTLFFEGTLAIRKSRRIPNAFIDLYRTEKKAAQNSILNDLYKFLRYESSSRLADTFISKEIVRPDIPPSIKSTMRIAQASHLFDSGKLDQAEKILTESLHAVPVASGVHISALQLLAIVYERTERISQAMETRIHYGGLYSADSGVTVELEEYLEIINDSQSIIKRFRETGGRISNMVNARLQSSGGILGFSLKSGSPIEIAGVDMDFLANFCGEKSSARGLIFRLGQISYVEHYTKFCGNYLAYYADTANRSLTVEDLKSAVELLYLVSFSNANIMNILFLNMKRSGLFAEFQKEHSIRYHRLKVDIAMELINHKLHWADLEIQFLKTEEIESMILEKDPFDATLFNQLSHGYELGIPEAREYFDNTLLYGYAYMLIQKSMVRDRFYRKLLRTGDELSSSILRKIKESVLRDLKNAEYQIQYILYTEQDNAEAYMLLGSMYQFIDTMRVSSIPLDPTLFTGAINLLTGGTSPNILDGRLYRDIYLNYFPDYLYETNVELYRQALELIGDSNPTVQMSLLSNLAGNYFILMNYRNASKYYSEMESLMNRTGIGYFDSHSQRVTFHLNFGRSLLYEGNAKEASSRLRRAGETLLKNEMLPITERYRAYRLQTSPSDEVSSQMRDMQSRYDMARYRMAVIDALIGLSETFSGNPRAAIEAYRSAYEILYETDHVPERVISRASLLNYIAIEYQKMSRFEESDSYARMAESFTEQTGLTRDDSIYEAQTAGGKLLGTLLNFGEDFSVIGEGRNPYGFSPLRLHELSLGIRLENRILSGDVEGGAILIEKRKEIFLELDGDVLLGKMGYLNTLNQEAYGNYISGNFIIAAEQFFDAANIAGKYGITGSYLINLHNYFICRFEILKNGMEEPQKSIGGIERDIGILRTFRENFFNMVRNEYVTQKENEIPDYTYSPEVEDPIVEKLMVRRTAGLLSIESTLFAFAADYYDRWADDAEGVHRAREYQEKGIQAIDRALSFFNVEGRGITSMLRLRINRGMILLSSDRPGQALREFRSAYDTAYEYNATREMWEAKYGALLSTITIRSSGRTGLDGTVQPLIQDLLNMINRHPEIRSEIGESAKEFFRIAADESIQRNQPDRARQMLQSSWSMQLENEFLKFSISFPDQRRSALFSEIRKSYARIRQLAAEESNLRYRHDDFTKTEIERSALLTRIKTQRSEFLRYYPEYFSFFWNPQPAYRFDSPLVRLFQFRNSISCWYSSADIKRFQTVRGLPDVTNLKKLLTSCIGDAEPTGISIISDEGSSALNPEAIIREIFPGINSVTHTTSESITGTGFIESPARLQSLVRHLNILNVRRDMIFDSGSSEHSLPTYDYLPRRHIFQANEERYFDTRSWIANESRTPILLIRGNPGSDHSGMIFEIARLVGTGTVIFFSDDHPEEAIRGNAGLHPYSSGRVKVYGIDGFRTEAAKDVIRKHAHEIYENAQSEYRDREYAAADANYRRVRSILSNLGERGELEFRAALRLSHIDLVNRSEEEETHYLNMIREYPDRGADIVRHRIVALYESARLEEAVRLRRRFGVDFSNESAEYESDFDYHEFKSRLGQTVILKSGYTERRFNDALQAIKGRSAPLKAELAASFLRIGHHQAAKTLGNPDIKFNAAMDEFILGLNQNAPSADESHKSSPYYPFCVQTKRDGSAPTNHISSEESAVEDLWHRYIRREDYALWNVQKLLDEKFLSGISLAERSALFRTLIELPDTPSRKEHAAAILDYLRKIEKIDGPDRASLLSIIATERMLHEGAIDSSLELFLNHLRMRNTILSEPRRLRIEAEEGLILMAMGRLSLATTAAASTTINIENLSGRWGNILGESGNASLVSLIRAIPKEFRDEEIQRFNATLTLYKSDRETMKVLAMILKDRAIRTTNREALFNAECFENEAVHLHRHAALSDRASALRKKIPGGQVLIALIDSNDRLYRITLSADGILSEDTQVASSIALSRNRRYLRTILGNRILDNDYYQEASRFYRRLLNLQKNRISYIYLPPPYAAAPIIAERGDALFQIFDPASLLTNEPSNQNLFRDGEAIRTLGDRVFDTAPDGWADRMRGIEKIALPKSAPNAKGPLHIFSLRTQGIGRSDTPWFLSVPILEKYQGIEEMEDLYNNRIQTITNSFSAPGIVTLFRIDDPCHPMFVRSYYERSKQNSIQRRYTEASLAVQKSPYATSCMTAYRPVTNSFVREN